MMRVLVACEYSGRVRDAFIRAGHYAMSCDVLPTEAEGPHYLGDVRDILDAERRNSTHCGWDLMVAHPPCTYLSVSGMHWTARGLRDPKLTEDALDFVRYLLDSPIPRICLENPVSVISSRIRQPDQIVNPYQFGEDASKKTCLWLKGLPLLRPTNFVEPRMVCCGAEVPNGDKYGCPNCNGDKVARPRWGNQCDSGQNKLGPSDDRWKERSRTFAGIAEAMAAQWGLAPNDLGNRRAAFGASALTDELERLTHEDLRKWAEALDKEMPRGLGERLLRFAEAWREQVDCSNTNKA